MTGAYGQGVSDERVPDVATYVVGDVHGHRDEMVAELHAHGITDERGDWAAGDAHVWFLGDFVDRGPDGVGAIDVVMRLQEQAERVGGFVQTLLGNHEILLLGMYHFGDTDVPSDGAARNFARSWMLNGGQLSDQDALTEAHLAWLTSRPVVAHTAGHLLLHSDTLEYLGWGSSIEEINSAVRAILTGDDLTQWWDVWRRMTTRFAFRGSEGVAAATELLERLGGERIVHGHSVIADQLGIPPSQVRRPHLYADGKVLGVDGGVFAGGRCLIARLPYGDVDSAAASVDGTADDDGSADE